MSVSHLQAVFALSWREWIRFYRQPSRIIGTLGTPLFFWLFLGAGMGPALPSLPAMDGGAPQSYLSFFFPGNVVLLILFTSVFASISLIEDRHEGFLQGVLVSPVPRWALVLGKTLGCAAVALLQSGVYLCLAPLAGFHPDLVGIGQIALAVIGMATSLSLLGFFFAWRFDSIQGFHSVMNLILFPMWLLSGAFFPVDRASPWIRPLMWINPLNYGHEALKHGLLSPTARNGSISFGTSLAVVFGFALVFLGGSIFQMKAQSKRRQAK